MEKRQHILVIRFSALGDVAMTVPVIYAVARSYPNVRITVLSCGFARSLFEDLAPNVNFMEADIKREYRGIKGLNTLYRRLVAKQFTHIADLHSVLRSEYLRMRFNLGRFRVEHLNKHRSERRKIVNGKRITLQSTFENYADVFDKLGFKVKNIDFKSIFPEGGGNLNLLPKVIGEKRSWETWIGIAPFAAHKGKVYPKEQMEEVVRLLVKEYPKCRIFLFGRGIEEESTFPQWVQQMPQCTDVSWHLETMHQELILMSHLDVMVSMDSANMHLASLTGTKVVSIWGATHPCAGFMGWNQKKEYVVQMDLDCRPCSIYGQKPCQYGDYRCLNGITPNMIIEKIKRVIN